MSKTTEDGGYSKRQKAVGKRGKTAGEQPSDRLLHSIGCKRLGQGDYVKLNLDVGNGCALYLLVDTGADVSLLKSARLLGTAEFEPKDKMRIRSVEGSVIQTYGSIETRILEGNVEIPFRFQLVNKQADIGRWYSGTRCFGKNAGADLLHPPHFSFYVCGN
jgi:hypothetical protein